jgi:hypothetical protein
MRKIIFNLLPTIFLWVGSPCVAVAQEAPVAQSDQITQDGAVIQDDDSGSGTFQPVIVDAGTMSDVTLQFPASLAGKPVAIEALDGGTLTGDAGTPVIAADASLAFSFQVTDQPGLHRVIVIDPNADEESPYIIAMVRFEVPEATQ